MPAVGAEDVASTTLVLADTLTFLADSTVRQTGAERISGGAPPQALTLKIAARYRVTTQGELLTLTLVCERGVPCPPVSPLVARLDEERLMVLQAPLGRRTPLVYGRVP